MSFWEIARKYILVHKCGCCRQILDRDHFDDALCPKCRILWNKSLVESCKKCLRPAIECECMPGAMAGEGALCLRRLFFYESEATYSPSMSIIFMLKHKNIRRITDFAARQLLPSIKEALSALDFEDNREAFFVCSVPRGRTKIREYGFDHGVLLASRIAQLLEVEYVKAFSSTFFSTEQKALDRKGRFKNAQKRIRFCDEAEVKGRYAILFDDIVTTGASMSACVRLLRKAGAKGVLCFSLASSKKDIR
ncbi:MAG: ComF family protein [Clostridia bacterium]|nr:ComF family protein [Clostridia bacterium]